MSRPSSWPRLARSIGLRARIALLVSAGVIAFSTISVILGLSALRASSESEIQQRAALAEMAASHLDLLISNVVTLENWAAADLVSTLSAANSETVALAFRDSSARLSPNIDGLLLFDVTGGPVISEPASLVSSAPALSSRSLGLVQSGSDYVVEWAKGQAGDFALVAVPVRSDEGRMLGLLGATVDFSKSRLDGILGTLALGRTGRVDLIDASGTLLTSTSDSQRPDSYRDRVFAPLMAQEEPVVTTATDGNRGREILALARLHTTEWRVAIRQPEDEVLGPSRMLQQQTLGVGLAALIVSLMMVLLTTRSVLKPVRSLTASIRSIAHGDLDQPILVEGTDELAELGRDLDFMRERLRRSIDEIKACNAELNRRVEERTADLARSVKELTAFRDDMALLIQRLSALNSVAATLSGSLDLQEVLDRALMGALKVTSTTMGAIYVVDEGTGEFVLAARRGISREVAEVAANLGVCASDCAIVARSGEPLVVENTAQYGRGKRYRELAEKMRCMVRVPFKSSGQLLGTICLGSRDALAFSKEDMDMLSALGNQVAVVVERAHLYRDLERKEKLRGDLLQKVISAQEDERKRIARELHDETSQALAALAVAAETTVSHAAEGEEVGASLVRMKTLALETLEGVHRLIFDLRPTLLDDLGLIPALRWYAESRLGEAGIRFRLDVPDDERRMGQLIETTLYRVVQEAISNAASHSGARNFAIALSYCPGGLLLVMSDDGFGFDMNDFGRSLEDKRGLGLMGMKERVELLGGSCVIDSEVGRGTRIHVEVPLERATRAMAEKIRVMLVDDHTILREGIRALLSLSKDIETVGEAGDGQEGLEKVAELLPDVVLMDIAMPRLDGLEATRRIKERFKQVKVLILTQHENKEYVYPILKAGADGYVLKKAAGTELVSAIKAVHAGGTFLYPSVAKTVVQDYVRPDGTLSDRPHSNLTDREIEVLKLIADGQSSQEIAKMLCLSVKTVTGHRTTIMQKLDIHTRTELVKHAIRTGLIQV